MTKSFYIMSNSSDTELDRLRRAAKARGVADDIMVRLIVDTVLTANMIDAVMDDLDDLGQYAKRDGVVRKLRLRKPRVSFDERRQRVLERMIALGRPISLYDVDGQADYEVMRKLTVDGVVRRIEQPEMKGKGPTVLYELQPTATATALPAPVGGGDCDQPPAESPSVGDPLDIPEFLNRKVSA